MNLTALPIITVTDTAATVPVANYGPITGAVSTVPETNYLRPFKESRAERRARERAAAKRCLRDRL